MCAINPKREMHFKISVYTSLEFQQQLFEDMVRDKIMQAEMDLNKDMRLRWHVTQTEDGKSHG